MDKDDLLRLANAAEAFLGSELWRYVEADVKKTLFEAFVQASPSDHAELERIRLTYGSIELFAKRMEVLSNHAKVHRAELAKKKTTT